MSVGKTVRTRIAPLALAVVTAVGIARVAGAQQSAEQNAQQPAAQQPPAQQPPAQQPPAQQPPAQAAGPAEATFSGNIGVLLVQIKSDQAAAYEALLQKLKESLSKNEKPERKAMAAGWKVYKSSDAPAGATLYVHIVDPVSPGQNYLETYKLIAETFPSEVQDLYAKTKDAFVPNGLGRLNLTLVTALQ
jgi:hypothetical protein